MADSNRSAVSEGSRGRLVGRYVVHDRIAAGGMATVHLGRLLGAAGFARTVAIKRLHDQYARDPEFVAMLLDEARLASHIRHPNVVQTLDVVAEDDELLVVMEYVEGDSAAHLAKLAIAARQAVPPAFAASIVAQALHGLHAAHEAHDKNGAPLGIVHRDVSPQNILVGVDGVARVLDFGVAKAASRATATEDGQIKGKTAYMAPEQLTHAALDRRTDIFAASIVLWELLAGRRLFYADTPAASMANVMHQPIDPPHRHAPDVPIELSLVCLRGLERKVDDRFATAEDMALAIEEAIALPRAKELGAWVAETSRATLDARAELVGQVERSSHRILAASTDPELRRAIEEAERRRAVSEMPTDVGGRQPGSHGTFDAAAGLAAPGAAGAAAAAPGIFAGRAPGEVTEYATVNTAIHSTPPRAPGRSSRGVLYLGIGTAAFGIVALVIAFVMTRAPAVVAAAPPAPASASASASASSAPSASDEPKPPESASAIASASPAPPPSATATTTSSRPGRPWRPGGRRGPPATPRPDCRVPFVVDANGNKHFKEECLN